MDEPLEHWRYIRKCLKLTPAPKQRQLAKDLGISRGRVSNLARLCRLPPRVIEAIDAGTLPLKVAEALCKPGVRPDVQSMLARQASAGRWSVRETARQVDRALGLGEPDAVNDDVDIASEETSLGETLGTRVRFDHKRDGSGWLRIHYTSLETLAGVTDRLMRPPNPTEKMAFDDQGGTEIRP